MLIYIVNQRLFKKTCAEYDVLDETCLIFHKNILKTDQFLMAYTFSSLFKGINSRKHGFMIYYDLIIE